MLRCGCRQSDIGRILIVHHDFFISGEIEKIILRWIKRKRHPSRDIIMATSVQEAMGILNTNLKIDLLIVNSDLPVLSGLQLIRHFQYRFEIKKVLMAVAPLIVNQLIDYVREGVDAVLPEPMNEQMLESTLDRLLC